MIQSYKLFPHMSKMVTIIYNQVMLFYRINSLSAQLNILTNRTTALRICLMLIPQDLVVSSNPA